MLYESMIIQRTKDLLDLPGSEETTKELELSAEERSLYDRNARILARRLREQVSEREPHSRFGLFQVHLQLRLLCNHGTYQNLLSWTQHKRAQDDREALLVEVGFNAERPCVICGQPKPILASQSVQDFVEKCSHIICPECFEDLFGSQGADNTRSMPMHCPQCREMDKSVRAAAAASRPENIQIDDVEMQDIGEDDSEQYFNPTGFSTKMAELIKDVKSVQGQMIQNENGTERHCKSIIFSCWTNTLDLVQRHLNAENIDHLRIDGQTLLSQRQRTLKQFTSKKGLDVLLMTTGTGAYG
jgi:SWI/SNF-related matrix-associated actin-dependent regulator of chromatin subfamily A3